MPDTTAEREALGDGMAVLVAGTVGIIGLIWAFGSPDTAMAFHGVLMLVTGIAGVIAILHQFEGAAPADRMGNYFDGPSESPPSQP